MQTIKLIKPSCICFNSGSSISSFSYLFFELFEVIDSLDQDAKLDLSLMATLGRFVEGFDFSKFWKVLKVLGCKWEHIWMNLTLFIKVINGHKDLTCLSDFLASLLSIFIPLSKQLSFLLVNVFHLLLLNRH